MKNPFSWEGNINNLWEVHLEHGEKNADARGPHVKVFHWGKSDNGAGVDGIFPMGDGGDVEHGVVVHRGIETSVITERAFGTGLAGMDESLDDEVNVGGHFERNGFAGDEVYWALSDESCEEDFVETVWERCGCGESVGGVSTEGYRNGHGFAALVVPFSVARSHFMNLPMHPSFRGRKNLHTIHAEVFVAGIGVLGVDAGEGDEPSSVMWPALENGKVEEGWERSGLVTWLCGFEEMNDVFAGTGCNVSWFGVEQAESLEG